ncbi:MAG: trypsin-like peptidase domain-containing protein [Clostridiales bacterium]|nr:trypsin-like peptidase domain-containing protein [Clostridiales bacterium]
MNEFETNENRTPDETINRYFDSSETNTGAQEAAPVKKSHYYRNFIICILIFSLCLGSISFGLTASGVVSGIKAEDFVPASTGAEGGDETEDYGSEDGGLFDKGEEADAMSMSAESIYEASLNRIAIIKAVKPSVVAISTVAYTQDWFFGTQEVDGSGSGFIFAKDAYNVYIATNNHVISGATDITVSFNEDTPLAGVVVGTDQNADLAVVSVSAADLKAAGINEVVVATFGDSDSVSSGDPVIAIGNALGEGITATSGIVSAISKKINIQGKTLTVIQTDAAINAGNSGGPLFNSKGEVIGINTAKFSSETVEGIGYSITSNVAAPIFEKLATGESTPTLGVTVQAVPEEYVSQLGTSAGAYVVDVTEGGNAYLAGIQTGDIITSFNGESIFGPDQLVEQVKECSANQVVEVSGLRNGKQFTLSVTLYPPETY